MLNIFLLTHRFLGSLHFFFICVVRLQNSGVFLSTNPQILFSVISVPLLNPCRLKKKFCYCIFQFCDLQLILFKITSLSWMIISNFLFRPRKFIPDCGSVFMSAALKPLSDYPSIQFISVLASSDCHFSFRLQFSWFLV